MSIYKTWKILGEFYRGTRDLQEHVNYTRSQTANKERNLASQTSVSGLLLIIVAREMNTVLMNNLCKYGKIFINSPPL